MAQNINNEHNSSRHVDFNTPMPTHNPRQPRINCLMHAERHVIEDAVERNSWGKSGCEWMCRFPNTGELHRTSGDAPLETHNLIHHIPWQPITNCRMCAERSVTEDAVEGTSWWKSKCEWICCVPNTERLHHSSVDTPLETHNNTHNTTWQPKSNWGPLQKKLLKKMPLGVTRICHGATCLHPILCCLEEPKWPPMPTKTNHTSLQGIPQNTKGESTLIENGINRLKISKMCKNVMSHQTGGINI
jgi:hypothetical protein